MLKYVKGDLIKAAQNGEVTIIAHCCNCFNTMGSGIAPQIAKAFPDAKEADDETMRADYDKLGTFTMSVTEFEEHDVIVYNLYGQYGFGNRQSGVIDLNYYYLTKALEEMREDLLYSGEQDSKIGFPKIGCGLAGGDWKVVSQIIETIFDGFDVTIYEL